MLQIGSRAPTFELPDDSMEMIQLSSFRGKKNVVLYFYAKDGTPSCTRESIDFTERENDFAECNTVVFGVSRDDCLSHEEFRNKHGLSVQLLSDTECEVCRQYDVLNKASEQICISRCTFIIDKKGMVRHILRDVNPQEHVATVLKLIRQIHGH